MHVCYVCGESADCRPYGIGGRNICFPCMKSSAEREREAEAQFSARLSMCESDTVIHTPYGPVAVKVAWSE